QAERMALQDVLWLGRHHVQIPSRTRRELARDFDLADHLGYPDRFMALLGRLWHLDNDPLGGWTTTTTSLRSQIERHVIRFPDDWTTEHFFEQLGAFEAPHPWVGPDPGQASGSESSAWLYDINVFEPFRRLGYASAILAAAEALVAGEGKTALGLNIVGDNEAAIALYHRNGYEVASMSMCKSI
ncbi:GNAT family N-acetyltransferase, partial [Streptomyces sp. NPDC059989]|uniref:GNAT family N-acetyltransferase n=1 Tax=Streptomyces sp. NPDC059989 TaxID=3347026 RepID=UPI00367B2247